MYFSYPSPLRYPGGKTLLRDFLSDTIRINRLEGGTYLEPFAGGAGAALSLLFSERVSEIHINDKDPCIFAFWRSVLGHTEKFLDLLHRTPVTVTTWRKQKTILGNPRSHSTVELGFATFYLNRCNRSGVLNGGPIGGFKQNGNYNIDARFNKEELAKKIEKIGLYRERIAVWNSDGVTFLKTLFERRQLSRKRSLVYMDPPFFKQARRLYPFYFKDSDHDRLASYLNDEAKFHWVISYDDTSHIRNLYTGPKKVWFKGYCLQSVKIGRELIMASKGCALPRSLSRQK
jgi:DNA adenine methylase